MHNQIVPVSEVEMWAALEAPYKAPLEKLYESYLPQYKTAKGSNKKYHAWESGYIDHILQVAAHMKFNYRNFNALGVQLEFSLGDCYVVDLLHDLEKIIKYGLPDISQEYDDYGRCQKELQEAKVKEFKIPLEEMHWDALFYAHGEGEDYSPDRNIVQPLGALLNAADHMSARITHDRDWQFKKCVD